MNKVVVVLLVVDIVVIVNIVIVVLLVVDIAVIVNIVVVVDVVVGCGIRCRCAGSICYCYYLIIIYINRKMTS